MRKPFHKLLSIVLILTFTASLFLSLARPAKAAGTVSLGSVGLQRRLIR